MPDPYDEELLDRPERPLRGRWYSPLEELPLLAVWNILQLIVSALAVALLGSLGTPFLTHLGRLLGLTRASSFGFAACVIALVTLALVARLGGLATESLDRGRLRLGRKDGFAHGMASVVLPVLLVQCNVHFGSGAHDRQVQMYGWLGSVGALGAAGFGGLVAGTRLQRWRRLRKRVGRKPHP